MTGLPSRRAALLGAGLVVVAVAVFVTRPWQSAPAPHDGIATAGADAGAMAEMVAVSLPVLSGAEQRGQSAFAQNCAACHGANAGGIEGAGPPLIHRIYEPNHHADISFFYAATRGVKSHHWSFGDMAPVPGVTQDDILAIIDFVRRVQRENGIS